MSKRVQFTEKDLDVIRELLLDELVKMSEDLATREEKSALIIPLTKIDQLREKATQKTKTCTQCETCISSDSNLPTCKCWCAECKEAK